MTPSPDDLTPDLLPDAVPGDLPPGDVDRRRPLPDGLPRDGAMPADLPRDDAFEHPLPAGQAPDAAPQDSLQPDGLPPVDLLPDDVLFDGAVPDCVLPDDLLPDGPLLDGLPPDNVMPDDDAPPDGLLPDGLLPVDLLPDGLMLDDVLPDDLMPDGLLPDDLMPDGVDREPPPDDDTPPPPPDLPPFDGLPPFDDPVRDGVRSRPRAGVPAGRRREWEAHRAEMAAAREEARERARSAWESFASSGDGAGACLPLAGDSEALFELALLAEQRERAAVGMKHRALAGFAAARHAEPDPARTRDPAHADREPQDYLAEETGLALALAPRTAGNLLANAAELAGKLPATLAALETGVLDLDRAHSMLRATHPLTPEQAAGVENKVLARGGRPSRAALQRAARRAADTANPDAAAERAKQRREERHAWKHAAYDGAAIFSCLLAAEIVEAIWQRITWLAKRTRHRHDKRTLDQLRADVFTALLLGFNSGDLAASDGQVVPVEVQVLVAASTLAGLDDLPAHLAGHGSIPADLARRLAQDAALRRVVFDPATGTLLDVGRRHRRPPRPRPGPHQPLPAPRLPPARHRLRPRPHPPPQPGRAHPGRQPRPRLPAPSPHERRKANICCLMHRLGLAGVTDWCWLFGGVRGFGWTRAGWWCRLAVTCRVGGGLVLRVGFARIGSCAGLFRVVRWTGDVLVARTLVVVDPAVGVGAGAVAGAWEAEPGRVGVAAVVPAGGRVTVPGAVELVVLPVAVNLASGVLFELVRRLVVRARGGGGGPEFEVVESVDEQGNRLLVVRVRRDA